jgi:hypothetical protein
MISEAVNFNYVLVGFQGEVGDEMGAGELQVDGECCRHCRSHVVSLLLLSPFASSSRPL